MKRMRPNPSGSLRADLLRHLAAVTPGGYAVGKLIEAARRFLGYTTSKIAFATREGLFPAIGPMLLPFVIFVVLGKLLPPWPEREVVHATGEGRA